MDDKAGFNEVHTGYLANVFGADFWVAFRKYQQQSVVNENSKATKSNLF